MLQPQSNLNNGIGVIEKTADWLAHAWTRQAWIQPFRKRVERFEHSFHTARIKYSLKTCGNGVAIQLPVIFAQPDSIEVGHGVSFGGFIHIWGAGGVRIGDRVMIGSHTAISSVTHDHSQQIMISTIIARPIVIEDDAWLGAHVLVLPGVTIGKGAVIGAGAVVNKDVAPGMIVAGVPARNLRPREILAPSASV